MFGLIHLQPKLKQKQSLGHEEDINMTEIKYTHQLQQCLVPPPPPGKKKKKIYLGSNR